MERVTRNRDRVPTGEELDKVAREPGGSGILRFFKLVGRFKVSESVAEAKRIAQVPQRKALADEAIREESRPAVEPEIPAPGAVPSHGAGPEPPAAGGRDTTPSHTPSATVPTRIVDKPQRKITISPNVTGKRAAARTSVAGRPAPVSSNSWEKELTMEEMHKRIGSPQQYGDDL